MYGVQLLQILCVCYKYKWVKQSVFTLPGHRVEAYGTTLVELVISELSQVKMERRFPYLTCTWQLKGKGFLPRYGVENADTFFFCTIKTDKNTNFNFYKYQNKGFQTKVLDNKDLMGPNMQGFLHEKPLDNCLLLEQLILCTII